MMFFDKKKKDKKIENWEDLPFVKGKKEPYIILSNGFLKITIGNYFRFSHTTTQFCFEGFFNQKNGKDYQIDIVPLDRIEEDDLDDEARYTLFHVKGYLNFNISATSLGPTISGQINLDKNQFDDLMNLAKLNNNKFTLRLSTRKPNEKELREVKLDPKYFKLIVRDFEIEDWSGKK